MSKPKKAKPAADTAPPGTIMGAKIRARANKLTDDEREALMGEAMRIIYAAQGKAAHADRRSYQRPPGSGAGRGQAEGSAA